LPTNGDDPPGEPTPPAREADDRSRIRLRRPGEAAPGEVEFREAVRGSRPGGGFLRLPREREQKLRRVGESAYEAMPAVLRPATALGRIWAGVRRVLIGPPLATAELPHERLSKLKALAIFSSDNLSSSAYATEEIILVLILAGQSALDRAVPIALAIAALAAIVATSYRQMVRAYPGGGGAYAVTRQHLGTSASLLTGATLVVDYILTVAVSTAAGVAAVTSAFPELHDLRIEIAVAFVAVLTVGNLRGIRESGTLFAIPPYFFILSFGSMIVVGLVRVAIGDDLRASVPADAVEEGGQVLTLFLLLRAFSSGAAALTGIEAIADGVPNFKPPEAKNAATTLVWMAAILASFFVGTTVLATEFAIVPSETKTVVAQIAETVFGRGVLFFMVQAGTALILVLAANTSFAGLPTLASVMAKDKVMPSVFSFRGDRLAFSYGILLLGIASSGLLIAFGAETHKLIPLYAFGVFMAFTLSQVGLVLHWWRRRDAGWRAALAVNAVGAGVTAVVAGIVGATKFMSGAWLSMLTMGVLFVVLWRIKVHYESAAGQLEAAGAGIVPLAADRAYRTAYALPQTVLVPVEGIDKAVLRTLAYARSISANTTAIHVTDDREAGERLRRQWEESVLDVPLVIVESPYRSLVEPILAYVDALDRKQPEQVITVVLPEFITHRFWHRFLHNQLSLRLKRALINRPNTVVVDVPYHLQR
jgi:amino acid transporter